MPKLEAKVVQRELDQGFLWPVYWLFGPEKMKSRELLKRIRRLAFGGSGETNSEASSNIFGLAEEVLDGTETDASEIVDAAQSPSLGGGIRLIVVRDAHLLKNPDAITSLMGPKVGPENRGQLMSVCVFLSKDLDGRKKFSKTLLERAAVVACEEIAEPDREAWIHYLAKRKDLVVSPELILQLSSIDPWSLDAMDQELEKYSLCRSPDVLLGSLSGSATGGEAFLNAFFSKNLAETLRHVEGFAYRPDEALPLLGLFAWNVRHLALLMAEQKAGTRTLKMNPYVVERLRKWSVKWTVAEVLSLQADLAEMDRELKQTPLLPLGSWSSLAMKFCTAA
ncbi:MAG: hypothetical protein A2428_06850 [Bdellovibrionales bacterium RIFOXYC1_FULL_54_43]|nr:MAG: hypothetical protein A2428_06850 [Bdellovibrionales bacterium RIFOXYC1_FULL_54_43]OFZ84435.1 MAG: hypothetical protein A2603_03290 [Bdellovibrionales bacterium RIFOXYD1_FULL_55_31]